MLALYVPKCLWNCISGLCDSSVVSRFKSFFGFRFMARIRASLMDAHSSELTFPASEMSIC